MMTADQPDVTPTGRYNISEAARKLGVHRTTINRWIKENVIRVRYRHDGRRFILGRDLLRHWKDCML